MQILFSNVDDIANQAFDYIIIGGGVAGSVIASRLSESPETKVLLLEAGQGRVNDHLIDRPAIHAFHEQFGNPEYDWMFQATSQESVKGRSLPLPRGKGMGGSSNINTQSWLHPGRHEIDAWEKLGNDGWGYKDFFPYLQKPENFQAPSPELIKTKLLAEDYPWYGRNGPIAMSFCEFTTGFDDVWRRTAENRGIPVIKDAHTGSYVGFWNNPNIIDPTTNHRCTAFKGYILPNLKRNNLSVLSNAYVTKLLFKTETGLSLDGGVTAEGVQFVVDGRTFVAHAAKEVIVCAGALKSPQILELSGIGDPKILKSLDIPILVDLPGVGENLQEHYFILGPSFEVQSDFPCLTLDMLKDPEELEKHKKLYEAFGETKKHGLFSFVHSDVIFTSLKAIAPDVADELIARHEHEVAVRLARLDAENDTERYAGLKEQLDLQIEHLKNPNIPEIEFIFCPYFGGHHNQPEPGKKYFTVAIGLVIPWSRGKMHITSSDPFSHAKYDLNTFDYPIELDILVEAFKWARKLKDYEPLKGIIVKEANPGSAITSDEEIRDHIRETAITFFHTTGTASMLPRNKLGVVDANLKVYGTTNVRVCDFSVPPLLVSVHPQCTAYAIAEKAADLIAQGSKT